MTMNVTVLGCGSSGGVPRVGGDWGACDPTNPKNRRRRCSILLSRKSAQGTTNILVDTSPDMRQQVLDAGISHLDGVWYTHEHADHTHGIDEMRGFFIRQRELIPIWADVQTAEMLRTRFAYCFSSLPGSGYPPILDLRVIVPTHEIASDGAGGLIAGVPFLVNHGNINALGFRVGKFAYTPDLNGVPDDSLQYLKGLDIWLVDALRRGPHPSHFSLAETLQWIERMKPKRAILTNMHLDLDFATLARDLPPHVEPAFDGMSFAI
jgi:phosphoribosyl 1,2-cyclic phosphate phosphodiesterase